jgi:hypothetical protein
MKLIITLCCAVLLLGCGKRTTPHKVERILEKDTWKITEFINNGSNTTLNYLDYIFTFQESGTVRVTGSMGYQSSGSWSVGENKNPAILYLVFPFEGELQYMSDDWQVTKISRNECDLTRNDHNNSDRIHFVKL